MALDKDARRGPGGETFICIRRSQVLLVGEVICLVWNPRIGAGTDGESEREKIGKQGVTIHGSGARLRPRDRAEVYSARESVQILLEQNGNALVCCSLNMWTIVDVEKTRKHRHEVKVRSHRS